MSPVPTAPEPSPMAQAEAYIAWAQRVHGHNWKSMAPVIATTAHAIAAGEFTFLNNTLRSTSP